LQKVLSGFPDVFAESGMVRHPVRSSIAGLPIRKRAMRHAAAS